jgi:hypothetical protein
MKSTNLILSAAVLALSTGASAVFSVANAAQCKAVRGALEETLVSGPTCSSPVGLCSAALIFGQFKGRASFTATAIIPTADTPATGVVFVTGDTLISNAVLDSKVGTVLIKNAAAFRPGTNGGDSDLTDTQVIVGGTGGFAGAFGSVRVTGTIGANGTGISAYEGTVCVP